MACNKDQGCLNIANTIYPELMGDINSSTQSITSGIEQIASELSGLTVPDDYLGNKVSSRIKEICVNLENDQQEVKKVNQGINSFVREKITEHQEHYRKWQLDQQRKKEEQEELEKKY